MVVTCHVEGADGNVAVLTRMHVVHSWQVRPVGKESSWNVDGELLPSNSILAAVHQGLLDVFARGVE